MSTFGSCTMTFGGSSTGSMTSLPTLPTMTLSHPPLQFPTPLPSHTPALEKQQSVFSAKLDSLKKLQAAMKDLAPKKEKTDETEGKFQPQRYVRKTVAKVVERELRATLGPVIGGGAGVVVGGAVRGESGAHATESANPLRDRALSAVSKIGVSLTIARFFPNSWAAYAARLGVDMTGDGAEDLMPFFVRQWERDRIERLEHPAYNLLFPLDADIRLLGILLLQGPRDALEIIEHNLAEALGHAGDAAGITDESIREAARAAYDWILRMVPD